MTIWILHQTLTPDEEARIFGRDALTLPFEGLPDLSMVTGPAQGMQLLRLLHPEDPPETLTKRFDRFWNQFNGLHLEDVIAVPLKSLEAVALAEVNGHYRHRADEQGGDVHVIPIKWYPGPVPLRKFGKHKDMFIEGSNKMVEVTDNETRISIRDKLPHSYNRFVKWKWLLVMFFLMSLLQMMGRFSR